MKTWIAIGGVIVAAALVGRWTAPDPAPSATPSPAPPAATAPTAPREMPRDDVRYVRVQAPVAAPDVDRDEPAPTYEQTDAADRALALVDDASHRRTWTQGDWATLGDLMEQTAPELRQDVLRELGAAIHAGVIVPETPY